MFGAKTKPEPQEFARVPQEIQDQIPILKTAAQIQAFTAKRDAIEADIQEAEHALAGYQWRPGEDDGDGKRVATGATIDEAAKQYLKDGELTEFAVSEDAKREQIRNRLLVLQKALEKHGEQHGQTWHAAVKEHLPEVEPLMKDAAEDVVECGRLFLESLKRQSELRHFIKTRGFRSEYSGWTSDTFEDRLLGAGVGEPLEHFLQRKSRNWSLEQ